jgi:hypothetical protein
MSMSSKVTSFNNELKKIWALGGIYTLMSNMWIIICIFFIAESISCRAPEKIMFIAKLRITAALELFLIIPAAFLS